jgi:predicted secreted Zn-dependent protease
MGDTKKGGIPADISMLLPPVLCRGLGPAALVLGLSAIVGATTPKPAFAQAYLSHGSDGSVTYSNKPPEPVDVKSPPLAMPPRADITSFQLNGAGLDEVQKDAALKGPIEPATGHRVWSATTWSAAWNYWTKQEADSCRIEVVSVRMKIATQLPDWREPKEVPEVDHCRWEAFVKSLRQKEEANVKRAQARGRALEREILALPPHPKCDGFAAEVTALGQKLVDDGKPHTPAPAPAPPAPPRALMLAKSMQKVPAKPVPPPPPKPLPIPQAIFDACVEKTSEKKASTGD